MNKLVKKSSRHGCTFLGKGIVDHPEMGFVVECREVILDEWDSISEEWKGSEERRIMFRTDTGYAFDFNQLHDLPFKIEQYAPNWRPRMVDAWGMM